MQLQLQQDNSEKMASQHEETVKRATGVAPKFNRTEAKKEAHCLPFASVQLLKGDKHNVKGTREAKVDNPSSNAVFQSSYSPSQEEVSACGIMKMAAAILLQRSCKYSEIAAVIAGDEFYANSGLPPEKYEDFELALLLQAAALRFSNRQFGRARRLLGFCQSLAFPTGNSLQRVAYYFAKALQERITKEIGGVVDLQEAPKGKQSSFTVEEAVLTLQPPAIACQYDLPFIQVSKFTAVQAILENVGFAKRIHFVDLGIKSVSNWPIMMQALVDRHDCPLELLKITAVAATSTKQRIEQIGKTLSSFAESMNIPFEFKLVVSELKDLKEDSFDLVADEVVVIYSRSTNLSHLLAWPDRLESLVSTLKKLNPCLMVVTESEAETNTPIFMDRFNSALPVYTALFDCLENCMDRDNPCRIYMEEIFLWEGIQNLITTEGEELFYRAERIEFWRSFLQRFGMIEVGLSDRVLCQANLLVKSNPSWSPCTVEANGKGLMIGWKGTPIKHLTIWKLHHE